MIKQEYNKAVDHKTYAWNICMADIQFAKNKMLYAKYIPSNLICLQSFSVPQIATQFLRLKNDYHEFKVTTTNFILFHLLSMLYLA